MEGFFVGIRQIIFYLVWLFCHEDAEAQRFLYCESFFLRRLEVEFELDDDGFFYFGV